MDGRYVVSASMDHTVKVWDLDSGEEQRALRGHTFIVDSVALSADGRYVVSASRDQTVRVWDLGTGEEQRTLRGHTDGVTGVALSADGRYVVSTSYDHTVKVWELDTGKQAANFFGNGALYCCATTPNGGTFVIGDSGGQIHFLRLEGIEREWSS
jgi:WD40 repeat protein